MIYISSSARSFPDLPYSALKNAVLGNEYELSLTFIGKERARKLNQTYRSAEYIPNVLSFPLSPTAGEVYITPLIAMAEAPRFGHTARGHVGFLFIHALLHLKGYRHGDTMERAEKKLMTRFKLK